MFEYLNKSAKDFFKKVFKAHYLIHNNTKVVFNNKPIVCVTTGMEYHKLTCPLCKGRTRRIMTYDNAIRSDYTPCFCISDIQKTDNAESGIKTVAAEKKQDDVTPMSNVTAFVDESYRHNPWRAYDNTLPEWQTSMSYIICRGDLDSEKEITEEKTIESNACLARWGKGTTGGTIEAIHTVLESLALKHDFHGAVKIYTDNTEAVNKWDKSDVSIGLASLFESITVAYIPRSRNRIADSIGRNRIFADISRDAMKRLEKTMSEEQPEKRTLFFAESFFPEPDKDLPKLINELENLSTAIGYYKPEKRPESEPAGSYDRIRSLLSSIRQEILVGAAI